MRNEERRSLGVLAGSELANKGNWRHGVGELDQRHLRCHGNIAHAGTPSVGAPASLGMAGCGREAPASLGTLSGQRRLGPRARPWERGDPVSCCDPKQLRQPNGRGRPGACGPSKGMLRWHLWPLIGSAHRTEVQFEPTSAEMLVMSGEGALFTGCRAWRSSMVRTKFDEPRSGPAPTLAARPVFEAPTPASSREAPASSGNTPPVEAPIGPRTI